MQGFAADPVYAKGEVFAYVGLPQNLRDLKVSERGRAGCRVRDGQTDSKGSESGEAEDYRGASLIRKHTTLGPYRRPMPRILGRS